MLLTITSGQRSPKVLMISAVWGRAPPWVTEAPAPAPAPAYPATSQDWLSVIKTRAFSAGGATGWLSWAVADNKHDKRPRQPMPTGPSFTRNLRVTATDFTDTLSACLWR